MKLKYDQVLSTFAFKFNLRRYNEPTSGLDAAAAASMVAVTLRGLASRGRGRVVVMSIHQPSPRSFRAFDRVMLMVRSHTSCSPHHEFTHHIYSTLIY